MALSPYNKIVLKSTTKMSLNDRFSAYRKNAENAAANAAATSTPSSSMSAIRQRAQQVQQQNSKNWRLIQQMENRPSVIAALKIKKRSLKQRLGQPPRTSVKARLTLSGTPGIVFSPGGQRFMGRGGGGGGVRGRSNYLINSVGGRMKRGGVNRGRGVRSTYSALATAANVQLQTRLGTSTRGWQTGQRRPFRGARRGAGARIRGRISWNQNWQQGTNQQARGGYRSGNRGGGQYRQYGSIQQGGRGISVRGQRRGGRGRGVTGGRGNVGGQQPAVTKQTLDSELDEYMSRTKGNLDMELDSYMAQMHAE